MVTRPLHALASIARRLKYAEVFGRDAQLICEELTLTMIRSILLPLAFTTASLLSLAGTPPSIGAKAPDFSLTSVQGNTVKLSDLTAKSPVLLIVLRGYPGYQCPFCQRQVQEFTQKAQTFTDAGVQVVFVYPGPPDDLHAKATEFLTDKNFPDSFYMLLDPGYTFTNLYGLRWDAPKETAYPSTFLIDGQGAVTFEKIVKVHGGRTTTSEIIDILPKKRPSH